MKHWKPTTTDSKATQTKAMWKESCILVLLEDFQYIHTKCTKSIIDIYHWTMKRQIGSTKDLYSNINHTNPWFYHVLLGRLDNILQMSQKIIQALFYNI